MPYGARFVARRWQDRGIPREPDALAREVDRYLAAAGDPPVGRSDRDHRAARRPHVFRADRRSRLQSASRARHRSGGARRSFALRRIRRVWRFTNEARSTRRSGPWRLRSSARRRVARASREIGTASDGPRARAFARDAAAVSRSACCPAPQIVPLVMGHQRRETAYGLGDAIAAAVKGRRAVLVASTDLSHYQNARPRRGSTARSFSRCSDSTPTA